MNLNISFSMGNRMRSTGWKRFQKTVEMTFWGDKPNGSKLRSAPEGEKKKIHRESRDYLTLRGARGGKGGGTLKILHPGE